jgi:hypothetical protein
VKEKSSQGEDLLEELTSDSRQTRQVARRRMIAEAVMSEGSMRIEDLTDRFGISLMTAHRDVDELVSRGLFRKTRGIVTAAATNLIESSDVYRSNRQASEKKLIAAAAMQFVEPGQAIFFDDSTTVLQMVPHLTSKAPITAITNSLTLMNALTGAHDVTLLALGGQYYSWCNAFMGRMTISEIKALRADIAINRRKRSIRSARCSTVPSSASCLLITPSSNGGRCTASRRWKISMSSSSMTSFRSSRSIGCGRRILM